MTEIIELDSFPDSFKSGGLILRTDLNKFFLNTGVDIDSPAFTELGGGVPTGVIDDFAGIESALPTGWLFCDGSEIAEAAYPNLFAVIGTTYNNNPSPGNFNLPDLETDNKFISAAIRDGSDTELGSQDGENNTTLTISQMPSHTHIQNAHSHTLPQGVPNLLGPGASHSPSGVSSTSNVTATNQNTGGGLSHKNRPLNIKMYKIIKI